MLVFGILERLETLNYVIPAKAGIQSIVHSSNWTDWVPAFAGTTQF